jgi:EAL domain-containing protein (putative c-di-GMP-specific phosphodiesterase class I)
LRITAEGIETEAQLESLKKLKCDEGQGFYFATPMTADEFRDYLSDRKIGPIHIDNIEVIDHVQ